MGRGEGPTTGLLPSGCKMINYDDFKEGVKTGLFRPRLRVLFATEMEQLENWEKQDGYCCGRVLAVLASIHFKVKSQGLTREQLV